MAATDLQSDARFAEQFVRMRASQGKGPVRISQELRQRGVADGLSAEMLGAFEGDWYDIAKRVWSKRFGSVRPVDLPERARQYRFMAYRGFTRDQIDAIWSS